MSHIDVAAQEDQCSERKEAQVIDTTARRRRADQLISVRYKRVLMPFAGSPAAQQAVPRG